MDADSLRLRIALIEKPRNWLNAMATEHHYMHRPVHCRAVPFGWGVTFDEAETMPDGKPAGFIVFASIHYTKLRGEFGYPGLPTKWQVLSLARLWLHDDLPHNSETVVIAKALKLVQRRWLEVHPPKFADQPYHILKIISYSDTRYHRGTIYRAANFREMGRTVSQKRHDNTRGAGLDGAELLGFVYDLRPPHWQWEPEQMSFATGASVFAAADSGECQRREESDRMSELSDMERGGMGMASARRCAPGVATSSPRVTRGYVRRVRR